MKKKLLPFILGLSMAAALPLAAHADDLPEQDSGNVEYGTFAEVQTEESGTTDVVTTIPECTMTIPRDTTIKRGAKSANIGRVTVDGHYFVKPYYIEVSADKNDFVKTNNGTRIADPLAKQDIVFDVATGDGTPMTTGTAASNQTFVQSGTLDIDGSGKTTKTGGSRACIRFWKDMTQASGSEDTLYKDGEVCDIKDQKNIWLRINETQWTGVEGQNNAATKPEGGLYKGNITFTATFRDNYTDGMDDWVAYPLV